MDKYIVKSLIYKLTFSEGYFYDLKEKQILDFNNFKAEIEKDILICILKDNIYSLKDAREKVEGELENWKILNAIKLGKETFTFTFKEPDLEYYSDRSEGDVIIISGVANSNINAFGSIKAEVTSNKLPKPNLNFEFYNEHIDVYYRYLNYKEGRELLTSFAYFLYTYMKREKTLDEISKKYKISKSVLKKLKYFTSTKGNIKQSRKINKINQPELTSKEIKWLKEAVKLLMIRLGEYKEDKELEKIKMSNLPYL